MSEGVKLQPSMSIARYTIEHRGGCVLIFGAVPVDAMALLTKLVDDPKAAVMSTDLARLSGATFAFGSSKDVDALVAELKPGAIELAHRNYRGSSLPDRAITWLAAGQRGVSSNTMFTHITGINASDDDSQDHPHDFWDWRRCEMLLRAAPELRQNLNAMRPVSPEWNALVDIWGDISNAADELWLQWASPDADPPRKLQYTKLNTMINDATRRARSF